MTNLQKHTEKVLRKFYKQFYLSTHDNELPKDIEDYFMPSDITYCEMKDFILQALSERDEIIIKMLEGLKGKYYAGKYYATEDLKLIHNETLDKAISIIKYESKNIQIIKKICKSKGIFLQNGKTCLG